jgi:glucose/arabinose dehydrogenase
MHDAQRIPAFEGLFAAIACAAFAWSSAAAAQVDGDADGIADQQDNCTLVANPGQRDSNADDYGNACDPDLDGDLVVDARDVGLLKRAFFTSDADADLNGDGSVNFADLALMQDLALDVPGPSGVASVSAGIRLRRVYPRLSFDLPVGLFQRPADNGRWFVIEQEGVIRSFPNVPNPASSTLVLDITDRVEFGSEAGLLGLAFHPDFPATPLAYVSYTRDGPNQQTPLISYISEFRTDDGGQTLDPGSERPILTLNQPYTNHNGGNIAFGPDGYLYIGFGDGGDGGDPQNHAQNVNDLLGSFLRIDIDVAPPGTYAIPPDNPFAGNPGCVGTSGCPEIYAWGVRNPWRWSFDTVTGRLWAGDVGQNDWEEIDVIENGGNYGWRCYEGDAPYNLNGCGPPGSYDFPVAVYSHSLGSSVTGGFVYRGRRVPALRGIYIYGDFSSGRLWGVDSNLQPLPNVLLDTPRLISSFGQDQNGEVYLVDYSNGGVYRIDRGQ